MRRSGCLNGAPALLLTPRARRNASSQANTSKINDSLPPRAAVDRHRTPHLFRLGRAFFVAITFAGRLRNAQIPFHTSGGYGRTEARKGARKWPPCATERDQSHVKKVFSVAAMALLVFVALGPATWQPRSGLGFELDHFAGYFVFTLMFCLAWPRPLAVGGALVVFALVLENLQSFLPDRSSYFVAALYSAAGVLAAALLAELFIRGRRRSKSKGVEGDSTQNA